MLLQRGLLYSMLILSLMEQRIVIVIINRIKRVSIKKSNDTYKKHSGSKEYLLLTPNIMSYSIKDLKNLVNSDEFKTFKIEDNRLIKLGEKIYGRRKDLAFTQSELADLTGIPQNKISQLESGTYGEPGRDILERLSVALNISIDYFLLDDIDRKTFEIYAYFIPKIKRPLS